MEECLPPSYKHPDTHWHPELPENLDNRNCRNPRCIRSIVERFAVLNQASNAAASRHYFRKAALARAPAPPLAAPAAQAGAQGAG